MMAASSERGSTKDGDGDGRSWEDSTKPLRAVFEIESFEAPSPEQRRASASSEPPTCASGLVTGKRHGTGLFAAVAIFSNVMAGPGVLAFPAMVQQAGWVCSLCIVLSFAMLTHRSCVLLGKAISIVAIQEWKTGAPLSVRHELSTTVHNAFGFCAFLLFELLLNVVMLLLDLASIEVAADSIDSAFVAIFGDSLGVQLYGDGGVKLMHACFEYPCTKDQAWPGTQAGITVGYVVAMVLCVPLTLTNFSEMMWFQYMAQATTFGAILVFAIESIYPLPAAQAEMKLPVAFGESSYLALSTCFFTFAIGFVVPSWWNDNSPACSVRGAIGTSVSYATILYFLPIAFIPAICFAGRFSDPKQTNALTFFEDAEKVSLKSMLAGYSIAIIGIMPNIIAYSVAMRDNVQALASCFTFKVSFAITCVGPWFFAWVFCVQSSLGDLVVWVAMGCNGLVNYIIPCMLVVRIAGRRPQRTSQLQATNAPGAGVEVPRFEASEVREAWLLITFSCFVTAAGYILAFAQKTA